MFLVEVFWNLDEDLVFLGMKAEENSNNIAKEPGLSNECDDVVGCEGEKFVF